jgi:hypothetical protein
LATIGSSSITDATAATRRRHPQRRGVALGRLAHGRRQTRSCAPADPLVTVMAPPKSVTMRWQIDNPEAGADAHRLGGEERREQPAQHVGRHPAAGVGDLDEDPPSGAAIAVTVIVVGAARHRLGGVDYEVEEHLAQPGLAGLTGGVGPNCRFSGPVTDPFHAIRSRPITPITSTGPVVSASGREKSQVADVRSRWRPARPAARACRVSATRPRRSAS